MPGAPLALSPGRRWDGPPRPCARPEQSGARGRGGAAGGPAPEGPGRGRGRRARGGGAPERRSGRSGPRARPGLGHDPRCSLLQARRRGPRSPAAAATRARAGPARGSAVSPPGSGECPAPCAPGRPPRRDGRAGEGPHGPGCPPTPRGLFCGDAGSESWAPSGRVATYTGRAGVWPRARKPLAPHSPPDAPRCHEFPGNGPDRCS